MNGIGQLLVACIEAFPERFEDYVQNKSEAKERCRVPMRRLKEALQEKRRVRAFINKAMFNGGEVNYLTVRDEDKYHVFLNKDVVHVFAEAVSVENSQAKNQNQTPSRKCCLNITIRILPN